MLWENISVCEQPWLLDIMITRRFMFTEAFNRKSTTDLAQTGVNIELSKTERRDGRVGKSTRCRHNQYRQTKELSITKYFCVSAFFSQRLSRVTVATGEIIRLFSCQAPPCTLTLCISLGELYLLIELIILEIQTLILCVIMCTCTPVTLEKFMGF